MHVSEERQTTLKAVIEQKYKELGPFTFHEGAVMVIFVTLVFLWMFQDPQFMRGWATYFGEIKPKAASAAIFAVAILFLIPAKPRGPFPSPGLIDWQTMQSKLSWGVLILRGGGFSLADAVTVI